jgi:hypothetical protein
MGNVPSVRRATHRDPRDQPSPDEEVGKVVHLSYGYAAPSASRRTGLSTAASLKGLLIWFDRRT